MSRILSALFAAGVAGLLFVAGALAETSAAPAPGAATPSPPPVATPEPTSTPIAVDGRECASGKLVNGFLAVTKEEPDPGCSVDVRAPRAETLYALAPVPGSLRFAGLTEGAQATAFYATYHVASGPSAGTPAIEIWLSQHVQRPSIVGVLNHDQVTPAGYFPEPGIEVRVTGERLGCWYEDEGIYCIKVYSSFSDLTLEEAAALLQRIPNTASTAGPQPPSVGTGPANSPGPGAPAALLAGALLATAALATAGVWARRVTR